MTESELTEAEIADAIKLLNKLAASPRELLERSSPHHKTYKQLRAALNRCVASIQQSAVAERKAFTLALAPTSRVSNTQPDADRTGPGCYMCGQAFARRLQGNPSLCQMCDILNHHFRNLKVNLIGRHAIVTGGRTGIGLEVVRRLLECGATVHMTTRFPYDAARKFVVPPFGRGTFVPADRLRIHGLDFRDLAAVGRFVATIREQCEPDILINNAAQTVRFPPDYYRPLLKREQPSPSGNHPADQFVVRVDLHRTAAHGAALLDAKLRGPIAALTRASEKSPGVLAKIARALTGSTGTGADPAHMPASALLSQVQMLPGDIDDQQWIQVDEEGKSADLRNSNTWTATIDDVDPIEVVEVQCINSIAPFMLTQGLFSGVSGTPDRPKFIVNLAAAEGAFSVSHHRGTHPHTNMAKAALNMLTRTIAEQFAERDIYVNSVDPGWVSDQRPHNAIATAKLRPPLEYADGAARVMQPILEGLSSAPSRYKGRLLRHYRTASW